MVSVLKAFKTPRNIADQDLVPAERASPLRDRPLPTHFAKCVGTRSQPNFFQLSKNATCRTHLGLSVPLCSRAARLALVKAVGVRFEPQSKKALERSYV